MIYGTSLLTQFPGNTEAVERQRNNGHLRELKTGSEAVESIAVRMRGPADQPELERVAGLDSALAPRGSRTLGAEVGGLLVAALTLDDGSVIADPFRPSAAAVELLRLRAHQLGADTHRRRRLGLGRLRRISRNHGAAHARAGLPGSPPGGGGRLLQL